MKFIKTIMNADKTKTKLRGIDLSGVDFSFADLTGVDLVYANLVGVNLSNANLSNSNLGGVNLSDSNLSNANLSNANLSDANLRGCNFRGCNLIGANLFGANLYDTNFRGANLNGVDLTMFKNDLFDVLLRKSKELAGVRHALLNGEIDGCVSASGCACLFGDDDSTRLAEQLFWSIKKGDTPENNQVSKITLEWIDEFLQLLEAAK